MPWDDSFKYGPYTCHTGLTKWEPAEVYNAARDRAIAECIATRETLGADF